MSNTKVTIKNLSEFKKNIQKFISSLITKQDIALILETARDIIYNRTKAGYGVKSDTLKSGVSTEKPLDKLSSRYIKYRKNGMVEFTTLDGKFVRFKVKTPKLGRFGSPAKSNLTLSGEMLESISYRIFSNTSGELYIPDTIRSDGKTNKEIAEYVSMNGRPFFNLSDKDFRILQAFVLRLLRNKLRSNIKL